MKRIITTLCASFMGFMALAAPNDTTVVVAHNTTQLTYYGNYDSTVTFPDGSLDYRKIVMEFNLGKYPCPNYDPSRPGEGAGQTGWCADWDYDVHVLAMTAAGDTFELGRLITPYANSNFINTPANWNQSYFYDVTDYYSILKDIVSIRIHYSGYSGGFTGTIKFHMIEGERAKDVLAIHKLWYGGFQYGNAAAPINAATAADTMEVPTGTVTAAMKMIITGHGNTEEGCAEFCRKYYDVLINGTREQTTYIWRDDCGANFLYPQSGTWIYDRGNWCPGDLVLENVHAVPAAALAQSTLVYDIDFQNYTSAGANGFPTYKLASSMFFYGDYAHNVDAGMEVIISPNNEKYYNRENPVFKDAKLKVKNYGATPITSIEFKYGINGNHTQTYTWNGTIAVDASMDLFIPLNDLLQGVSGANTFDVKIEKVNGAADDEPLNNEMQTNFDGVPEWNGGKFSFEFRVPGTFNNGRQPVKYTVYNQNDSVLLTRTQNVPGNIYTDELTLPNGFYKLVVETSRGAGLSFFNYFTSGYFRVFDISGAKTRIAIPRADLGGGSLEGNFGSGFTQTFRVVNSVLSTNDMDMANAFEIFPNPANEMVQIKSQLPNAQVKVYNVAGALIYTGKMKQGEHKIATQNWASGVYQVQLANNQSVVTKKVVIQK